MPAPPAPPPTGPEPAAVLWHLGQLHAVEQALVVLLAFGPFVVLGVVVAVVRRRDLAREAAQQEQPAPGADPARTQRER